MGDLISRQNAIRWVKTECNPYGKPSLDYESGVKVINHLENMRSEQQWIPCSEQMPFAEYGESYDVLCCLENGTMRVLCFNGANWFQPNGDLYISVNHENGWHNRVVAWMPLPEPFEGGNR